MAVDVQENEWSLMTNVGIFIMHAKSDTEFVLEYIRYPVVFKKANSPEGVGKAANVLNAEGRLVGLDLLTHTDTESVIDFILTFT